MTYFLTSAFVIAIHTETIGCKPTNNNPTVNLGTLLSQRDSSVCSAYPTGEEDVNRENESKGLLKTID